MLTTLLSSCSGDPPPRWERLCERCTTTTACELSRHSGHCLKPWRTLKAGQGTGEIRALSTPWGHSDSLAEERDVALFERAVNWIQCAHTCWQTYASCPFSNMRGVCANLLSDAPRPARCVCSGWCWRISISEICIAESEKWPRVGRDSRLAVPLFAVPLLGKSSQGWVWRTGLGVKQPLHRHLTGRRKPPRATEASCNPAGIWSIQQGQPTIRLEYRTWGLCTEVASKHKGFNL